MDGLQTLVPFVELARGKPHKIEVRGHTARALLPDGDANADRWELSYRRSRVVMESLVQEFGINPERIRLSVAGPHEPLRLGQAAEQLRDNPRVEVFLLDEVAGELGGSRAERSTAESPP
jgi:chemotaxis protein MotB